MQRKTGTIYSFNPRGWAFIFVTPLERYFAHISEIKLDHLPAVGETVSFETVPPRKPGQLPCAVNVEPVEPASAKAAQ
jgi:cold shock CspA family protein